MTSAAPLLPEQKEMMMATNMTSLEQDLKKQILGRSKAEKVFRPWWDTLEDYLLNILILIGQPNISALIGVKQDPYIA